MENLTHMPVDVILSWVKAFMSWGSDDFLMVIPKDFLCTIAVDFIGNINSVGIIEGKCTTVKKFVMQGA
jgi:hypothetical protein